MAKRKTAAEHQASTSASTPAAHEHQAVTVYQPQQGDSEATQRAAQMLDDLGERIGRFAALASHEAQRLGARMREEGEDIWAEAQSLRQQREGATSTTSATPPDQHA